MGRARHRLRALAAPEALTAVQELTEQVIDRWLERGTKFFKTVSRNPVVRSALLARGLSDEELAIGWKLYSEPLFRGRGGRAARDEPRDRRPVPISRAAAVTPSLQPRTSNGPAISRKYSACGS